MNSASDEQKKLHQQYIAFLYSVELGELAKLALVTRRFALYALTTARTAIGGCDDPDRVIDEIRKEVALVEKFSASVQERCHLILHGARRGEHSEAA